MDIISLLITLIGIVIILGLYIIGRISRNKLPQAQTVDNMPDLLDETGTRFTSIQDDIPATDGSLQRSKTTANQSNASGTGRQQLTERADSNSIGQNEMANATALKDASTGEETEQRHPQAPAMEHAQKIPASAESAGTTGQTDAPTSHDNPSGENDTGSNHSGKQQQLILFIASQQPKGMDGNRIHEVLAQYGLSLGEMDIYHYLYDHPAEHSKTSLFRIANGVAPWTLKPQDLRNNKLPGLSMMMQIPTPVDDVKAVEFFVQTAQKIATELKGILKNDQQQPFAKADMQAFLKRVDSRSVKLN